MNNAQLIVEANSPEEAAEKAITGESKHGIAQILKSISSLKSYVHFHAYISKVIDPELNKKRSQLERAKDPIEMYRLQGFIEALEKVKDLESYEKIYKNKLLQK